MKPDSPDYPSGEKASVKGAIKYKKCKKPLQDRGGKINFFPKKGSYFAVSGSNLNEIQNI
jgi:hypothetical protein